MGVNEYIKIGQRIKKIRTEKGYSQKEFAKMVGLPLSTYSNYENDNREPKLEIIERIADTLGVTIDYFLNDESEEYVPEPISLDGELVKEMSKLGLVEDEERMLKGIFYDFVYLTDEDKKNLFSYTEYLRKKAEENKRKEYKERFHNEGDQ